MARLSASAVPLIHYCVSSREIYPSVIPSRPPPFTAKCTKGPFFSPLSLFYFSAHTYRKAREQATQNFSPFSRSVSPSVHPLSRTQRQAKQSRSPQETGSEKKALASGNQEQHPGIRACEQTRVSGTKRKHRDVRLTAPVNLAVGECPIIFFFF